MKPLIAAVGLLALALPACAQDQQLGARTKAMGGSYTAFEDDPVSIWLNPAGIATQSMSLSIAYQSVVTYPLHEVRPPGGTTSTFSAGAETTLVEPAIVPSFLGLVFPVGPPDSGFALGICYAQPYHLNYSFDQVADPFQTSFTPDSNVDQSFGRFRIALAKDFRFEKPGVQGFLTHLSVGVGLDVGYERWEFKSAARNASDNATGFGAGAGLLVGVYDDGDSFRVNFGTAWQSAIHWNFNIDPDILPAFDMPQQINVGFTFYLLSGFPLRATLDYQWIQWSGTAEKPFFAGKAKFRDVSNTSLGLEYRIGILESVDLYPRLGYRRFQAPWSDPGRLPMVSNFELVLDTKGSTFNIVTFGVGVGWTSPEGKVRSLDVGADAGGDSYTWAVGFNYEF
jgi:long-subunit fatty acid transport protein